MLDYEDIFTNSTMQLDLNFPASMFATQENAPASLLTMNGVREANLMYSNYPGGGIVWAANKEKNSVWSVKVSDFKWKEQSVIN
jgi:hypothetical protein